MSRCHKIREFICSVVCFIKRKCFRVSWAKRHRSFHFRQHEEVEIPPRAEAPQPKNNLESMVNSISTQYANELELLEQMGFKDRVKNLCAISSTDGDFSSAIDILSK